MATQASIAVKQHAPLQEILRIVEQLDPEAAQQMTGLAPTPIPNSVKQETEFATFLAIAVAVLAKRVEELGELRWASEARLGWGRGPAARLSPAYLARGPSLQPRLARTSCTARRAYGSYRIPDTENPLGG